MRKILLAMAAFALSIGAAFSDAGSLPNQTYPLWRVTVFSLTLYPALLLAPIDGPPPVSRKDAKYVVLPAHQAKQGLLFFNPHLRIQRTWNPARTDIHKLEADLPKLSLLLTKGGVSGVHILHPENSYRQYVGVVVNGHKFIYINAFPNPDPGWRTQFVTIADGAQSVWHALYDPVSGRFSDLVTNGRA